MATLVIENSTGNLVQTQIGPADLIATFKAAHDIYGWLGGFSSVHGFLRGIFGNKLDTFSLSELCLDHRLELRPVDVTILTETGPQQLHSDGARECFGVDPRMQHIGLAICALAHEIDRTTALDLLMEHLVPFLFERNEVIMEALRSKLAEAAILTRIINEGVARGFTNLLDDRVRMLGLPLGDRAWLKANLCSQDNVPQSEVHMVGGLLKWVRQQSGLPYSTRSGLTARVASYLQTVGFPIGTIKPWNGSGQIPAALGPNAVVLVLGGSYSTDELMLQAEEVSLITQKSHYTFQTVGGLLANTLGYQVQIAPETLQTEFERIHEEISSHVEVQWIDETSSESRSIYAEFRWKAGLKGDSAERRLASLYFPRCSDSLAFAYRSVASEDVLKLISDPKRRGADDAYDTIEPEIARFRALTAAIAISIIGQLSRDTFKSTRHLTTLDLINEEWLDLVCRVIDKGASGRLQFCDAVWMLATIHAGHDPENSDQRVSLLGWKHGVYSVLPTLLHTFDPCAASIGLTCSDKFVANVPAAQDGQIFDAPTPFIYVDELDASYPNPIDQITHGRLKEPWIGDAICEPPDCTLHISIERPLHSRDSSIYFTGRFNGSVHGGTSVLDVLRTIIRSSQAPDTCDHTPPSIPVYNVHASRWLKNKRHKPAGTSKHPAHVLVHDDPAWTLFLAGQAVFHNARIVHRCMECTVQLAIQNNPQELVVLIGYIGGMS